MQADPVNNPHPPHPPPNQLTTRINRPPELEQSLVHSGLTHPKKQKGGHREGVRGR